jgi:hypothetical protein
MAIKFLADLNLSGSELVSAALETRASAQEEGNVTGQVYFNTTNNQVEIFNGSGYIVVGKEYSAGNGITLTGTVFSANANDGISVDANGISVDNTVIRTSGAQTKGGNMTFSNDVTVTGNLTVNGTQTILNTAELAVEDTNITLNSGSSEGADSGISVNRGQGEDIPVLQWNETNDRWEFTNDGSTFYNIPLSSEYGIYSLPIASTSVLGGVKDGARITISADGTISADTQTANDFTDVLQTKLNGIAAGADAYGSWTVSDGTNSESIGSGATLAFRGGTNTTVAYDDSTNQFTFSSTDTNTQLSTADVRGKISASGLVSYDSSTGVITTTANNFTLSAATAAALGGIKVGSNLTVAADGTLSGTANTQLSAETVKDYVADVMVGSATHVGISASDADSSNAVNLTNNFNTYTASITNHAGGDFAIAQSTSSVRHPANISLYDTDGNHVIPEIVYTSGSTKYTLVGLPAGSYEVVVSGKRV